MQIKMVQNDTLPVLEVTLTQDGNPIDLTGCSLKFYMKEIDTGAVKINGASMEIISAKDGTCRYSWTGTDTNTAGTYEGEVEVTYLSGKIQTAYKQLIIVIRDDI